MQRDENRIAPIAALVAIFVVSVTIVGLTFWSGDLFKPWTSVPPAAVERPQGYTHAFGATPGQSSGPAGRSLEDLRPAVAGRRPPGSRDDLADTPNARN